MSETCEKIGSEVSNVSVVLASAQLTSQPIMAQAKRNQLGEPTEGGGDFACGLRNKKIINRFRLSISGNMITMSESMGQWVKA